MTDCFALLDEPRQPVPDLDSLKAKFLALSAEVHPDRLHNAPEAERLAATERYSALNVAYNTLRETKDRLGHLLELELGAKASGIDTVPAEWIEGFMEVGQLCRSIDAFLAESAKVTSPLLKVQRFQQGMEWTDRVNATIQRLTARLDEIQSGLQALNPAWLEAPTVGDARRPGALPLEELTAAFRGVSFLTRWMGQLRERTVKLAM